MFLSRQRGRDERGQVIVILALFMVVLMLFAAVVFDAGAVYLEQRQDVAAADGGVLAGGARLLVRTTLNKDQVGREAVEVARQNLRPAPAAGAWDTLFQGCNDNGRDMIEYPAGDFFRPLLTNGQYTDCVHFNRSFTKIRIRIPDQILSTTFSRLVGINTMRTYAVAEAAIAQTQISDRVMPFATTTSGSPGDMICFVLDRNNCGNHPSNQGLRVLDAPLFGGAPATLTTAQNCGSMFTPASGQSNSTPNSDMTTDDRAAANAALGLDHTILIWPGGTEPKRKDDCGPTGAGTRTPTPLPNHIYATEIDNLSSNSATGARRLLDGLAQGLAFSAPGTFADAGGPRLYRYPRSWPTTWPNINVTKGASTYNVDDRPLWDFIRPNATIGPSTVPGAIPANCARSTFNTSDPSDPGNIGPMADCLNDWISGGYGTNTGPNPADNPLFDYRTTGASSYDSCVTPGAPCDIQFSTRSGVVPFITPCSGNCQNYSPSQIDSFQIAFIQVLFTSTAANRACPCMEYSAGTAPLTPLGEIAGFGGFALKDFMLPESARPSPTNSLSGTVSLYR